MLKPRTYSQVVEKRCSDTSPLSVKDSYWRWPQPDRAGNTIDFFVQVLGLSFHQAMRQIIADGV